jgi:hypothetical protein
MLQNALVCDRRLHCRPCRTSTAFREGLVRRGVAEQRDFACPYGVTAESLPPRRQQPLSLSKGPGAMLKRLLGMLGIHAAPDCACNRRAAEMDRRGPLWCWRNRAVILGWLREEAQRRQIPFHPLAARLLIATAILISCFILHNS